MIKTNQNVKLDEDIHLSEIHSPILKVLCCSYDSLYSGEHESDFDIYFFDKQGRFFFTFTDSLVEIKGDILTVSRKEVESNKGDFCFHAPILRAVYVCKSYRGQGLQSQLFKYLNQVSEDTGQSYVAIADPFKLKKSCYEHSANEAFYKFMTTGHERSARWNVEVLHQCKKFESYGMQNFILPDYEITQPFQHYIYVPDSALDNNKLAVKSLQANPDMFIPSGVMV